MKRFCLLAVLLLTLALAFGCSKKAKVEENVGGDVTMGDTGDSGYTEGALTPEMQAAVQRITDGRIYFAYDRFDIQPEYNSMLREKAELLKKYPNFRVRIEGNCDSRGTEEYNLALGERRARVVYEYLVMLGVNPSQLEMISYGEGNPAVMGENESAWAKNRRDDFRVVSH